MPQYDERALASPATGSSLSQAIDLILKHQEPYPPSSSAAGFDVLAANDAASASPTSS